MKNKILKKKRLASDGFPCPLLCLFNSESVSTVSCPTITPYIIRSVVKDAVHVFCFMNAAPTSVCPTFGPAAFIGRDKGSFLFFGHVFTFSSSIL